MKSLLLVCALALAAVGCGHRGPTQATIDILYYDGHELKNVASCPSSNECTWGMDDDGLGKVIAVRITP